MKKKTKYSVKKTIICDAVLQSQIAALKDYLDEATEVGAMRRAIAAYPSKSEGLHLANQKIRDLKWEKAALLEAISGYTKSQQLLSKFTGEEE